MSNPYVTALDTLKADIAAKEAQLLAELIPLKTTANQLSKLAGLPDAYDLDAPESNSAATKRGLKFKEDQFFNKPLATSVVAYMEARDEAKMERPASIDEIYDSLVSGGFKFEGATGNPENSKRALKIALTKNTAQFVKIGEKFALKKWYGMRAARKSTGTVADDDIIEDGNADTPGETQDQPSSST